jgi:predicted transcriptional regulator
MAIAATSLKLPSTLKTELEELARRSGETTHAIMVRALTEHVAAAKRYRLFLDDATHADASMLQSGVGYAMQDVHAYVAAKVRGEPAKRPKPVKWRK